MCIGHSEVYADCLISQHWHYLILNEDGRYSPTESLRISGLSQPRMMLFPRICYPQKNSRSISVLQRLLLPICPWRSGKYGLEICLWSGLNLYFYTWCIHRAAMLSLYQWLVLSAVLASWLVPVWRSCLFSIYRVTWFPVRPQSGFSNKRLQDFRPLYLVLS